MLLGNLINTRLYGINGQLDAFLSINNPAIPRGKPNGNSPWNQANRFFLSTLQRDEQGRHMPFQAPV